LLLAVVPGLAASALAVFVLYAVNMSQAPEPGERLANIASSGDDNLSAEERRELTRQMLRARRENPQVPAEVSPTPRPTPVTVGTAAPEETAPAVGAAPEAKPRPDRVAAVPPVRAPRQAPARSEAATANVAAATAPVTPGAGQPTALVPLPVTGSLSPVASPPAAPPAPGVRLPPVEVNTLADRPEAEQRGFAGIVFSSISGFAGTAANATGNTVNWVIALPGRAVSAGGRLLGRDSAPSDPPNPPPAAAPLKQNLL
jgi:hypothetical protein